VSLQSCEPGDLADDDVIGPEAETTAVCAAMASCVRVLVRLDARPDHGEVSGSSHSRRYGAVDHGMGDSGKVVGAAGRAALKELVDGTLRGGCIRMKRQPADGVQDQGHAGDARGEAAEDAGLGAVRVDDGRPEPAEQGDQVGKGGGVPGGVDVTPQLGHQEAGNAAPPHLAEQLALRADGRAADQDGVPGGPGGAQTGGPGGAQTIADGQRALLRAAEDHARDDVHNADGRVRHGEPRKMSWAGRWSA